MKIKEYYFDQLQETGDESSNCCDSPAIPETDVCSECKEHADFEEVNYEF